MEFINRCTHSLSTLYGCKFIWILGNFIFHSPKFMKINFSQWVNLVSRVIAFVHDNFLFEHLNVQNRGLFVVYIALFPSDLSAANVLLLCPSLRTVISHTSLCCSWFPKSVLLPWSLGCCGAQDSYKIHLLILLIHSLNFVFLTTFPLFYFHFLSFYIVIIL